jgi:hypothetical protein
VTGTWTCKSCEDRLSLDTKGQAVSLARQNFCGASRHVVFEPVRWAPGASGVGRSASVPVVVSESVKADDSGQLGLF